MFAPLSIHLDSLKKVFYDKNELMRSGIELNKNFLIYTNENENKDFFVGYLSNIDDGTGFEISAGLFLNRRISIPRTILEKTFLGNIELSDSLGFDGTKLKVITLDTLEATLEEEGLPASAKAIKLLKQEIDSFVAGNLPPATIETIGGVIVGDGIEVDVEGTIRTPKSKNTKGSDIISNTGTTFLLNTGINVLNRNIDFDIEFSIINPSNSATKLFVSGSHIYVESTLSNFKGFSDGNITSVKGFVKDNLLHIYIENLCTSIVCDKIDGVDIDYPNNAVFVNKPFISKQELPTIDILKETDLNLKVMILDLQSANEGIAINGSSIELKPAKQTVIGGVIPDGSTIAVDVNGVISTVNRASTSTQIIAGTGLTGGGTLAADRTLNIVSANAGIVVNADNIELKPATTSIIGGVKIGADMTVTLDGTINPALNQSVADDRYVNVTGDTITGSLNINGDLNGGIFKNYDMSALSSGTTYTNTTGRAMFISISEISNAYTTSRYIELFVNNSRITRCDNSSNEVDDLAISVIVPPGATYKFICGTLSSGGSRIFYRCY